MGIKKDFFNSIKNGTGEAYLIAKNNPKMDFSNSIIKAILRDTVYDRQAEGNRAEYLYRIIKLSLKQTKIKKAIFQEFIAIKENDWILSQLFEILKYYSLDGDKKAKKLIKDKFLSNPIEYCTPLGSDQILELEGLEGLLFVANKIGIYLKENPKEYEDGFIIEKFQEENPKIDVWSKLEKASKNNTNIKFYLDYIKKNKTNEVNSKKDIKPNKPNKDKTTFETFLEYIERSDKPVFQHRLTIKKLTKAEIKKIANNFLLESNLVIKARYLYIFTLVKYPYNCDSILKLAKYRNIMREDAIYALKFLKSKKIREFALQKIQMSNKPYIFMDLLINNYKNGDAKILKLIAQKYKNEDIIESLASSYIDIFKNNKTKECKEPLLELYKKMNCGIHRNSLLEVLLESKVLPNNIKREMEFDSYDETRELFQSLELAINESN